MNILYYIPNLNQAGGGIRQYAVGLLKILSQDKHNNYYILHNNDDPEVLDLIKNNLILIPKTIGQERNLENFTYRLTRKINLIKNSESKFDIRVRSYLDRICKKYKIDIVHSPWQSHPFPSKMKNVFTLHDVQELHFPEYFSPEERANRAVGWVFNIEKSDKIVVSYKHVKDDLIKFFNIPESKIHVILLNMGNLWFGKYKKSDCFSTFSLHHFDKYVLYPANTWEHKNHILLLKAIANLRDDFGVTINLICTGHQNAHFEKILKTLEKYNLHSQVKFLGIRDEMTLFSLYHSSIGVVIPTMYEAGSFPLMESILMDIPVICSNVTSLAETMGDSTYTFDPTNLEEISTKLKLLWTDLAFRESNVAHTACQKQSLLNTNAFEKVINLYNELSN